MKWVFSLNNWLQLFLVIGIIVVANLWSSKHFTRLDLTKDGQYSLEMGTRALVWKLDKPLYAKVFFTQGLQSPYNNHEAILIDKLEELQAYSQGWMKIERSDPTNRSELAAQAQGFGIESINYRYKSKNSAELKKVYMGMVLVYGDRQETLPAITRVETLEYDLARALRRLVSPERDKSVIGLSSGHDEPSILQGKGPLEALRMRLDENYTLRDVRLGTDTELPTDLDMLWVVGPQRALSTKAQYQIDQFLMQGGSVGLFLTNTKPNLRTLRADSVFHGLEGFLAHYGVQLQRNALIDRVYNGEMAFPVRQGKVVRQVSINHPLILKATTLEKTLPVMRGMEFLMSPFSSSLSFVDPLPVDIEGNIWASTSEDAGRVEGLVTINPQAFTQKALGEVTGSVPILVQLSGAWTSYFADKDIGASSSNKITQGAPARLVVGGSADLVANNLPFMLNLADWMVEDSDLIDIRAKIIQLPQMERIETSTERMYKAWNLLFGTVLIGLFGGFRFVLRFRREKGRE
jgi:ABC-2 type transport system permease protein